ncbi:hypothetical protein K445DRAFT_22070 [Daldinia sp. EC12]|nr:hypothetical protein K445DRAFT_22070 [Daldinia sp. EC12]
MANQYTNRHAARDNLSLNLRYINRSVVSHEMHYAISRFLENHLSEEEAVYHLDSLRPTKRVLIYRETAETQEQFLDEFWRSFLELVFDVPPEHDGQWKLLNLILQLNGLNESGRFFWAGFPRLREYTRSIWKMSIYHHSCGLQRWVNLNSFFSRMYGASIIDWYDLGIHSLRWAFEREAQPQPSVASKRVKAAAQWMINAAPRLFRLTQTLATSADEEVLHEGTGFIALTQPEYIGDVVFTETRWIFWNQSFLQHSSNQGDAAYAAYTHMNYADGFISIQWNWNPSQE